MSARQTQQWWAALVFLVSALTVAVLWGEPWRERTIVRTRYIQAPTTTVTTTTLHKEVAWVIVDGYIIQGTEEAFLKMGYAPEDIHTNSTTTQKG